LSLSLFFVFSLQKLEGSKDGEGSEGRACLDEEKSARGGLAEKLQRKQQQRKMSGGGGSMSPACVARLNKELRQLVRPTLIFFRVVCLSLS
jgi:hypothetical protein